MEKRLILAISLSLLVLLSWSAWVSKLQPTVNKEVTTITSPVTPAAQPIAPSVETPEPVPVSLIQFHQESSEVIFSETIAAIKEVVFKKHQDYKFPLQYGLYIADKSLSFQKTSSSSQAVTFVHSDQNKRITKQFIFDNSNYTIELDIQIQNLSSLPLKVNLPLILGGLDFDPKNIQARYQDVTIETSEKSLHPNAQREMSVEAVKFVGLRDRYFCAIVEPLQKDRYTAWIKKVGSRASEVGLSTVELIVAPNQQIGQKFHIYLGPQDLQLIKATRPEWLAIVNYGPFGFIAHILLRLLNFLFGIMHNWGWAIVVLSLLIYVVLYPLTLKQMRSMKEMQIVQPLVEELRRAYKDNPQKLNKEIMELYRQHKVNPLGGCLPLILQFPIFLALYQTLMRSIALKGANFLWIKDLSEPDRLFILPIALPIIGNEINILPIIMAIGMFAQQKMSSANTASSMAEQQKLMIILFPVMFGFIFYHMPSGLVLYWLLNSILMLTNQFYISRQK